MADLGPGISSGNRSPDTGQRFLLPELARTLYFLADEDAATTKSRAPCGARPQVVKPSTRGHRGHHPSISWEEGGCSDARISRASGSMSSQP